MPAVRERTPLGRTTRSLLLPGLAAVVVGAAALSLAKPAVHASGGGAGVTLHGKTGVVAITNYAFKPVSLTVKPGTRITWTNHDATAHTATVDNGSLDTGTINPGQSKTIDFTKPGTYTYHCAFHAFMTGTIKVVR